MNDDERRQGGGRKKWAKCKRDKKLEKTTVFFFFGVFFLDFFCSSMDGSVIEQRSKGREASEELTTVMQLEKQTCSSKYEVN